MQIDPTHLSKISAANIQKISSTPVEAPETAGATPAGAVNHADRIVLSQQATEVQAAHEALAQTPEVRAELVDKLKAQVEAGTYKVDPDRIAGQLLPE